MTNRKYGSCWRIITEEDLKRIIEEEKHQEELELAEKRKFTETFWKRNLFSIILELIFVISCFFVPEKYFVYTSFGFYLIMFLQFFLSETFSFPDFWENIRSGRLFWRRVILTSIFFTIAISITVAVKIIFPDLVDGIIKLKVSNSFDLVFFIVTTMFLSPIVEETFFRRNIINPENKVLLTVSFIFNLFLVGIAHASAPLGIFLCMIWAIPLSIVYVKFQNFYIGVAAHMIVNILFCILSIIMVFIK